MDEAVAQELVEWAHQRVRGTTSTAELQDLANDSNLSVEAKRQVMELAVRDWTPEELTEEFNSSRAAGGVTGVAPASGSPV